MMYEAMNYYDNYLLAVGQGSMLTNFSSVC